MARRGRPITIVYTAVNITTGGYVTGDVANHTLRWCKDGVSAALAGSPAEIDATNLPGRYKVAITPTEANASVGVLGGKSSTANVQLSTETILFEDEEVLGTIRLLRQWIDWIRGNV